MVYVAPAPRSLANGFTLLEVLVALVIVATTLAAGLGAVARTAEQGAELQKRALALWVAHNVYSEARLKSTVPATGGADGDAEMGPYKFRWHTETIVTEVPSLKRMDIRVSEAPDLTPLRPGQTAALVDKPYAWATLTAFFADMSAVG